MVICEGCSFVSHKGTAFASTFTHHSGSFSFSSSLSSRSLGRETAPPHTGGEDWTGVRGTRGCSESHAPRPKLRAVGREGGEVPAPTWPVHYLIFFCTMHQRIVSKDKQAL